VFYQRKHLLPSAAVVVGLIGAQASLAWGQTSPITNGSVQVQLQPFATVPTATYGTPQDVVTANDGSGRLFVAARNGSVLVADSSGNLNPTPFLTVTTAGVSLYTGGEGGLLGLAFSPNYSAPAATPGSGRFYTFEAENYNSATPVDFSHPELAPAGPATPNNQLTVREWSVNPGNPNLANSTSRVLMTINHPQSNHQGGSLKFGPDGNLYVGLGDGGGGNDLSGSATSSTDGHTNSVGNGQDTTNVFGSILRIDPKGNNSANGQYGIPADNPFAASATNVKEIFAFGLRNPFHISFDRASGKLLAGDVGQGAREEVDVITNGGNYGWPFREGTRDNAADAGRTTPGGFSSLPPIAEYTHADGDAIIGGFVYRGSLLPSLTGKYVFGDLNGTSGNGRLFYTDGTTGGLIQALTFNLANGGVAPSAPLYGFGEGANGELYAFFSNGQILAIVPEPSGIVLSCLALLAAVPWLAARFRSGRFRHLNNGRQPAPVPASR